MYMDCFIILGSYFLLFYRKMEPPLSPTPSWASSFLSPTLVTLSKQACTLGKVCSLLRSEKFRIEEFCWIVHRSLKSPSVGCRPGSLRREYLILSSNAMPIHFNEQLPLDLAWTIRFGFNWLPLSEGFWEWCLPSLFKKKKKRITTNPLYCMSLKHQPFHLSLCLISIGPMSAALSLTTNRAHICGFLWMRVMEKY